MISTDGLEYYIKALDNSTPPNINYFGKNGQTNIEPNSMDDIDISFIKDDEKNKSSQNWYIMITPVIIIFIVIIALSSTWFFISRKNRIEKKDQISGPESAFNQTSIKMTNQKMDYLPKLPSSLPDIKCNRCGALLNQRNECPNCGISLSYQKHLDNNSDHP